MKKYSIPWEEIISLEASGNYTLFNMIDGARLIYSKTLKSFELELGGDFRFVRVSRSVIVNKKYVIIIKDNKVCLDNGSYFEIARRRKKAVYFKLN